MTVHFQGNYRVYGKSPESVQAKINEIGKQNKLTVPVTMKAEMDLFMPDNIRESGVTDAAYLLTDEDAVDFLKQQGIEATVDGGPEQTKRIYEALSNLDPFARQLYPAALMIASLGLEGVKQNLTVVQAD